MNAVYALMRHAQRSQTFVDLEMAELRRRGVGVTVVSNERGEDVRGDTVYVSAAPNALGAHAAWLARHPVRYARFLGLVWALRSEMGRRSEQVRWWRLPGVARSLDADVVHTHFGWSGAATAALLGALLGVPWSVTLHANDIFGKPRNLRAKVRRADLVVTVCEYNRRLLGAPAEVITCGVEVPPRVAREPDVDVVTVARLVPKKGVDTLVAAMAALPDATCEVVGDGPLLDALKESAPPNVTFRGSLPHGEALERIAAARVFALPCRIAPDGDRDAMPTVLIEAMMRGVPVVSTNVVGIPEMVDAEVGRLVEPDDPDALAAALREVLADPALARRLGEAGARRARERYSLEGQAGRLLGELEALCR
ncbi:MAG TPA: glycosyltransferase family 4 protein [Mycobacteriales bacterium]|jgi:glycosyltransferase involved in cell wall biosynthesis